MTAPPSFDDFAAEGARRLQHALVASFGTQVGVDAAAGAVAYAWEHWARVSAMENPVGYLYRVGQNLALKSLRPLRMYPSPPSEELPEFDPGLLPALEQLTESQRASVVLVHGFGWAITEVADLLEVSHSTVRTHIARGLARLHEMLEDQHVH